MKNESLLNTPLWEEFAKAARRRRRNPMQMLTEFMREQLEIWEFKKLDEEIRRDVQRSGYTEDDAIELVRQYRREKKQTRAAS
jgi:uncharacterized protein YdaU (DUF1376 family)